MAIRKVRDPGFLYKRKIDKLVGGATVDWNSGPVLKKITTAINRVNKRAALRVKRKARGIIRQRAYETGDLYRSVNAIPSIYQKAGFWVGYSGQVHTEWIIMAGDEKVDYAGHVELGRYFEKPGTRVAAVPYMRQAAANTRKWLRPRMKAALQRAIA